MTRFRAYLSSVFYVVLLGLCFILLSYDNDVQVIASENQVCRFIESQQFLTKSELESISNQLLPETMNRNDRCATAGIPYLANYNNPCFYVELKNTTGHALRCLPHFYVVGFQKSGTTTIYSMLYRHPDFVPSNLSKELHWWGIIRLTKGKPYFKKNLASPYFRERLRSFHDTRTGKTSFEKYLQAFSNATKEIDENEQNFLRHKITGDFSPSSADGTELKIPDDIYWLTPSAKIIVIMRNPTHRLMSWYNDEAQNFISGESKPLTPEQIHEDVKRKMSVFRNCTERLKANDTNRYSCVSDENFRTKSANDPALFKGCYAVFLRRYLSVFPPEQILILRFEDMIKNVTSTAQQVFRFLGLKDHQVESDIWRNQSEKRLVILNSTIQLLNDFYSPFNKDLAKLLDSEKWLWKD